MLKSINNMLDNFHKNNINYCHWKSNEHLEPALNGDTDLDILFDYTQRSTLEKILAECGLKRFRSTPLMQYNGIEDFIGFDKETAKIWHLHTHYKMTLGESHLKGYTITPWSDKILDNKIMVDNTIYTSSYEYEYVLLLCRIALKNRWRDLFRNLSEDDIRELNWLLERINKEKLKAAATDLVTKKYSNIILSLSIKKLTKRRELNKLQKVLRKILKNYTSYNIFTSYITRTKREIFWLIGGIKRRLGLNNYVANRRVSPSGGTVVALLGCDGAGKSTTLSYLKKEFSKKIDVVSIYYGSGDGSSSLIRKPMKLVAKKVAGKGVGHKVENEYKTNKHISFKSRLYSLAKIIWAVSLAKEKKKKFKKMIKARNNGLLVLTDRYPQIIKPGCSDGPLLNRYINKKGFFGKISRWERNAYERISLNPPDLTIKLMVPTEIAIERKPEMTTKEIEDKKSIINDMNISKNNIIIDTSKPFEKSISEVMSEIWRII